MRGGRVRIAPGTLQRLVQEWVDRNGGEILPGPIQRVESGLMVDFIWPTIRVLSWPSF